MSTHGTFETCPDVRSSVALGGKADRVANDPCAKSFGSASSAEAPYLADNVSAMTKMMIDMGIRPSGDVDTDFVAMMVPAPSGRDRDGTGRAALRAQPAA